MSSRSAVNRYRSWPCLTLSLGFTRAASTNAVSSAAYHDAKIEDIRNIGIIAHVDANPVNRPDVDHGDTITDFLPMERARGITIQSAAISFNWPPKQHLAQGQTPKTINLIDTPGHQDFRFEVDRCLPVLDGAVCIIDAVKGVEAHTERVWASAQQYSIPRLVYVNKLDRDGASFQRSVLDVASRLNAWPLVCHIPLWDKTGDEFQGVVDVLERRGLRWSSNGTCSLVKEQTLRANEALWDEIETARVKLIERLCEDDDELVEAFSEQGADLPSSLVKASIRRVVRTANGSVVPVFAGSSLRNIGVEPLLDAVVDYLPNPQETHDVEVRIGQEARMLGDVMAGDVATKGGKKARGSNGNKALTDPSKTGALASVFKVVNDPSLFAGTHGMLTFVRVYHGSLHKNAQVWNANLAKFEKPFQIAQVSAAKIGEIPYLAPGQIGAVTGLKSARTGDTLHILPTSTQNMNLTTADLRAMTIRPPDVGPAVAFVSVEAYGQVETKKLADALDKISREDPSLRWQRGEEAGSEDTFVLSGMGQLHLDVAMDRLRTTYQVNASFSDVQVDYKECLATPTTGPTRYVYDRTVANKTGMAACTVEIERIEEDEASELPQQQKTHRDEPGEASFYFQRDGNVFVIRFEGGGENTVFPFDLDMVSRQLFSGAYGALARGPRRGSPLHGCKVTIVFNAETDYGGADTDGHIVNAALHGVRNALRGAHDKGLVGVLEPVMNVRIACPDDSAGAIQRDITGSRGGFVLEVRESSSAGASSSSSMAAGDSPIDLAQVYAPPDPYVSIQSLREAKRGVTRLLEIVAKVPLKEMLAYDTRLRSMTGGRHSFTMELGSFERVVGSREKNV
ncbi:elongation factor G [Sporothrix brasiliensis 5110]|uniref:Elongation factor G n=1 Tax=Sporothrix brasiliensis 5110 TaxID=1398154 RepID=A0A0C2ER77_9PEZI|nr:elongation factor G [Sporothrix brasiliensis 5110]KIH88884.1 elongation factor G [Sporothrix brasiliensis 5110]